MLAQEDEKFLKTRLDELAERVTKAKMISELAVAHYGERQGNASPMRIHALVDAVITSLTDEERAELFG